MSFEGDIRDAYGHVEHRAHPYIGGAFRTPNPNDLRVAVVGLNAYYSERHWPPHPEKGPDDWAWRFEKPRGRYFTSARNLAKDAAKVLLATEHFAGRSFEVPRCVYASNAVKSWVRDGKSSRSVTKEMLKAGAEVWREELQVMVQHGVFPHVILVLAEPFWRFACASFKQQVPGLEVLKHHWTGRPSDAPHHVNRYAVEGGGARQPVVRRWCMARPLDLPALPGPTFNRMTEFGMPESMAVRS